MKISTKGRYRLSSMIYLGMNYESGQKITTASVSKKLNVSRIYLEQIFAILKSANLVKSLKGSQRGYYLSKSPENLSVYEILSSLETNLVENVSQEDDQNPINQSAQFVYDSLNENIKTTLDNISLQVLVKKADELNFSDFIFKDCFLYEVKQKNEKNTMLWGFKYLRL